MRIICATDGSRGALAAAQLLAELPWEAACTISLLGVIETGDEAAGERAVTDAAQALAHTSASLERSVRRGHAAEEILRAAEDRPADLIVLGSHGRSAIARFFVGSVAERVARHAPCPVLVARPRRAEIREIVVGVDASDAASRAAEWLGHLPLLPGCEIRLVTVLPNMREISRECFMVTPPLAHRTMPFHEWQREKAQARLKNLAAGLPGAPVTELRSGDPDEELVNVALDEGADLIAVGSEEHKGAERFLLGSISENLVRRAPCSVLIVKQPAQ